MCQAISLLIQRIQIARGCFLLHDIWTLWVPKSPGKDKGLREIVFSFFRRKHRIWTIQRSDDLPFLHKLPLMNMKLLEVAFLLDNGLNFGERFQLAGGIDQIVKAFSLSGGCPDFCGGHFVSEGSGRDFTRILFGFRAGEQSP